MAAQYSQYQYGAQQGAYRQDPPLPPAAMKPQLPRSISTTNLETTRQCQDLVQQDFCTCVPPGGTYFFINLPMYTFTIPQLNSCPPDFRQFVFERIVDKTAKKSLEEEKCLNWCMQATKLEPLHTKGDGNCLLHAASLGMWGFQDRANILRNAVSQAVAHAGNTNTLFDRWRHNKTMECRQQGYELEPRQWQQEWQTVVRQASSDPTATSTLYSLEEFHVFVLANVLRRPVIMYASQKMRSIQTGGTMQCINFHGLYLPLLWDPKSCKKDPLPLAYQNGHFSALVVVDFAQQYRDGQLVLPLVSCDNQPLPVRFTLHGENQESLLNDYLSIITITGSNSPYPQMRISCASLSINLKPAYYDRLVTAFIKACYEDYCTMKGISAVPGPMMYETPAATQHASPKTCHKCQEYFGAVEYGGLCHGCFTNKTKDAYPSKCPGCTDFFGDEEYGGFCYYCFLKKTGAPNRTFDAPPPASQSSIQDMSFPAPAFDFGNGSTVPPVPSRSPERSQAPKQKVAKDISIEALMKRLEDTESEIKRLKNESHTQVLEVEQQKRQLSQALKAAEDKISNVQRLATYEYQLLQHRMTELELSFPSASQKSPNQPFWVVPRSDIVLTEEEVGRGGWGTINVALFRGQRVAAKSLHNEIISPHNIRLFTREMNVMAQVRHPNIVLFIGATNEGVPVVLTELMAQSLRDLLTRGNVANPLLISIASDVTRALNYLHLNQPRPLIHRDVSSANVLLNPMPDSMWTAKVSDFGSTNFLNQTQTIGPGNPVYAAPESYNPLQHTPKMDVFSFGVLLIEMCSCQLPPVEEREELIRAINWPECEKLIRDCLKQEPSKRPSMGEVLVGLGMM